MYRLNKGTSNNKRQQSLKKVGHTDRQMDRWSIGHMSGRIDKQTEIWKDR
jgi:hypothetical protein